MEGCETFERLHAADRLRKDHVVVWAAVVGAGVGVRGPGVSASGGAVRQGRKSQDLDRRGEA